MQVTTKVYIHKIPITGIYFAILWTHWTRNIQALFPTRMVVPVVTTIPTQHPHIMENLLTPWVSTNFNKIMQPILPVCTQCARKNRFFPLILLWHHFDENRQLVCCQDLGLKGNMGYQNWRAIGVAPFGFTMVIFYYGQILLGYSGQKLSYHWEDFVNYFLMD